jgi:methionyl-tRNA formyltransferase
MNTPTKFVFFGSSEFSFFVLEELKVHQLIPSLIVTTPDKPKGRKLLLTSNIVKTWAIENNIPVLDPVSLKNNPDLVSHLISLNPSLFLVASYGKIIPKEIFEIPEHKTLNIHPSLLPKYRGASPIQSQILNNEKEIGVTIMQIEETMDTGPIISQKKVFFEHQAFQGLTSLTEASTRKNSAEFYPCPEKPDVIKKYLYTNRNELEKTLAIEGARLFILIILSRLFYILFTFILFISIFLFFSK